MDTDPTLFDQARLDEARPTSLMIEPKLVLAVGARVARGMLGRKVSLRKFLGAPQRLAELSG